MPINKSRLFRDIYNRNSYLHNIKLPFDKSVDQVMDEVLTTVTLPTWSSISPIKSSFSLNTNDLTRVRDYDTLVNTTTKQVDDAIAEKKSLFEDSYFGSQSGDSIKYGSRAKTRARGQGRNANVYFLPDEITRYNLIDIISVYHDRTQGSDEAVALSWYRGSMMELIPAVIDTIAYSGMIGAMGLNEHWEFIPPNKIKLDHLWDALLIKATFEHRNLLGIGMNQYYQLSTLFNLDFRVFIYNIMNQYDGNINSAYGSLNIKLDNLANAEAERNEFVKTLNDQLASSDTDWIDFI